MEPNSLVLEKIKQEYSIINGIVTRFDGYIGSVNAKGYRQFKINIWGGKNERITVSASHIAWFLSKGIWPTSIIDHKDRNKENNSPDNLRDTSHSENMRNCKTKSNKYGTGVKKSMKGYYEVYFKIDGKKKYCGSFKTAEAAAKHYKFLLNEWNEHDPLLLKDSQKI